MQFGAVPWLSQHLLGEIQAFLQPLRVAAGEAMKRMRRAVGGDSVVRGEEGASLVDVVQTPEQQVVLDRLTALMTLLEGHADFVMDGVGPEVVPSVALIRERFDQRRTEVGSVDGLARGCSGSTPRCASTPRARAFVAGAVERVGLAGFNRVWSEPRRCPRATRCSTPAAWCTRVAPDLAGLERAARARGRPRGP